MTLLLSGSFIPEWFAILMLIGLVVTPAPLVMGIVYFVRRDYVASTFVIALGMFMACAILTAITGAKELALPGGFSSPFGYLATYVSHLTGSKGLSYFVGTLVNLTAIFAVVRFIQKKMDARGIR